MVDDVEQSDLGMVDEVVHDAENSEQTLAIEEATNEIVDTAPIQVDFEILC